MGWMVVGHVCFPKKRFRCPPSSHREPLDPYFTLQTPPCFWAPSCRVSRFINNNLVHPAPGVPLPAPHDTLLFVETRPSLRQAHPNRHPIISNTCADRTPEAPQPLRGSTGFCIGDDDVSRPTTQRSGASKRRSSAAAQRILAAENLGRRQQAPAGTPSPGAGACRFPLTALHWTAERGQARQATRRRGAATLLVLRPHTVTPA